MNDFRKQKLADFVAWTAQHIRGDEKGEAQIFLDRLFQAFAQGGIREAGATLEMRVRQADSKGTAFADLVWKPIVLIEMKKRGEDLARHYRQAFDYWTQLVPNRPRYVILCNFDEFWVFDFETQMDTPVDVVSLADLPDRYGPLNFLFPTQERPVFGNDQEAVTRDAADKLATCFNKLVARGVERPLAQKFTLQMLVALFAEDIGLLEKYFVTRLLEDCQSPTESYDLLGGLFEAMNSPAARTGGRFRGVPYFNGGLFAAPARLELYDDELNQLRQAARGDWSKVRPEIFGTLFEHSLDKADRHAFGQHFTSPVDIMKIVTPTIVQPWREQIEQARTLRRLRDLHQRMQAYTVLDPACGSGNFLYIAYRELKRLEASLLERIAEQSARGDREQLAFGFVTARQFYGMDISPFACELAKVTMMIARKFAIDELHVTEQPLPLDNLDANFIVGDALIDCGAGVSPARPTLWPKADAIIGNPPFLGAKRLKPERGADYVNAVRRAYPDVPGMADYCVYWLRKANDLLEPCTAGDPLAGRAGLVGTQNIRNNQSRVGGLDAIVKTGTIVEAVDNQPWSGEANVHVSIVNWVKTHDAALLPPKRRLYSLIDKRSTRSLVCGTNGHQMRLPELQSQLTEFISSTLSSGIDISSRRRLTCNSHPKRAFQGKILGYDGFLLDEPQANCLARDSAPVVVPFLTGREMLDNFHIRRWVIDFGNRSLEEAAMFRSAFDYCREHVLPAIRRSLGNCESIGSEMVGPRMEHLNRWWQFWNRRDELTRQLQRLTRYIACSRVTRRPIMVFVDTRICPSDALQVFALDDDYSFGILQSSLHFEWFRTSSRLKAESDLRYSSREIFDTFPWPQAVAPADVMDVAESARHLRRLRQSLTKSLSCGLRDLYRLIESPGRSELKDAHAVLDEAVLRAYGFSRQKQPLLQLMNLNKEASLLLDQGRSVNGPGIPAIGLPNLQLMSDDKYESPNLQNVP